MAVSSRSAARLAGVLLLLAAPLAAQSRVGGRIVRLAGADTLAVARVPVVLHGVSRRAQGPLDTVIASADGRFGFRFRADSGATYLVSVRWAGIEYFSSPLATNPARPDTGVLVIVSDTSSRAPVRVRQRTVLVSAPDDPGSRLVLDWFVLANASRLTRVAADTGAASWGAPLPRGVEGAQVADSRLGEFSPDAVTFRADSVLLRAPLSPGDRELLIQYRLPAGARRLTLPGVEGTDSVHVLLEEGEARVRSAGFAASDSQSIEGRTFRRWSGPGRGGDVVVLLPGELVAPRTALVLLVTLSALGFLAVAVLAARRRRVPPPAELEPVGAAALVDAIARLDLRYEAGASATPADEWARYQSERARLAGLLARALAAPPRRS